MARGWESKAVEEQIEESDRRADEAIKVSASAQTREHLKRLESLNLSRSRMLEQLEKARHPAHREVLMKGLQAIEKEIEEEPPDQAPSRTG